MYVRGQLRFDVHVSICLYAFASFGVYVEQILFIFDVAYSNSYAYSCGSVV